MKECVRCHVVSDDFRPMAGMRDGLDSWCRGCHREYSREHMRRRWIDGAAERAAARASRETARSEAAQVRRWEREAVRIRYGPCETCGDLYVFRDRHSRYCSSRCRPSTAARHQRTAVARREVIRACLHCGTTFAGGTGRSRFCTNECGIRYWAPIGNAKRRALKKGAYVEHVFRRRVFERDAWTCYLCGDPVDRDADRNHPRAPQIDHFIPLARGGEHSYANVRTAHRFCNISKGTRLVAA